MIQNQDIVVIGIQPWNIEIGSNCKNIAQEMAKNNRVLYVNHPLDRITRIKGKNIPANMDRINVLNGLKDPLTKVLDNLWEFNPEIIIEPINKFPVEAIFDFFNRINMKRLAKEINKAVKMVGLNNYILFNDSSMFLGNHIKEYLDYKYCIYYIRDNLINSPSPYWNTHGKRIEKMVIKQADVVVTNSIYYTDYSKQINEHSYMVGQGCDTSLFDYKARIIDVPEELIVIKKPIIGYVGYLTKKRLDLKLIEFIAKSKPEWQIVLVGPEDDTFLSSDLHSYSNIHFLGSKPSNLLPEYINGFDICINPQVVNNTTIGNYPRKIDEYLAMGKPVIATHTKAMEYFSEFTYLGETETDYINLIQKALNENSDQLAEKRRNFALTHSWENNLKEIWLAVENAGIKL